MIRSFANKETENLFDREYEGSWPVALRRLALRKLVMLHAAQSLIDLRVPPGNRLEKLAGDRKGQFSIRVNLRFRICFAWIDNDAYDVELVDYY